MSETDAGNDSDAKAAALTRDHHRRARRYMRKVQLLAYSRVVWADVGADALAKKQTSKSIVYCEVGLNAGHGTIAMLLANPHVQVRTRTVSNERLCLMLRPPSRSTRALFHATTASLSGV
jgi:hypothetical protein